MAENPGETKNRLDELPEKAAEMKTRLESWATEMRPPRLPGGKPKGTERQWYRFYTGK